MQFRIEGTRAYRWFQDLPIRLKVMSVHFFGMGILLLTLSLFLILISNQTAQEDLIERSRQSIELGNTLIEKEKEYISGIAEYFSVSSDIQDMLRRSNSGQTPAPVDDFLTALQNRMYILSTVVYNRAGDPVMYMAIDNSSRPVSQTEEDSSFSRVITGRSAFEWSFVDEGDTSYMQWDYSPKLCLWHLIKDNNTMQPIGVVVVSLDTRKLLGSEISAKPLRDSLIVLESTGRCVYSGTSNPIQLSEAARTQMARWVEKEQGNKFGSTILTLDHVRYRVSYGRVAATDFYTFHLVPYQSLLWNTVDIAVYAVFGLALCLLLVLPVSFICSTWITKPVAKLAGSMEQFAAGDDSIRVCICGNDEIGRLGKIFNSMVEKQHRLIEKNYKEKIRRQEAELEMQQAQMSPHFLYNMLHSIQWMALKKKVPEIANTAYALANFFRATLNRGNNVITLREELEIVNYYLYLQDSRFPDMITCTIGCDGRALYTSIPKLIIQPLLENSITHGMKGSDIPLHIRVSCAVDETASRLVVSVEDDGKGFDAAILPLLPDKLPQEQGAQAGCRFALRNINTRLKLMYQDDCRFRCYSPAGGGAGICIETPLIYRTGEE